MGISGIPGGSGPNQATKFVVQKLLVPDAPFDTIQAFSRAWLPTVLAAWTLAPIILWQNGVQIPETDNPPFNARPPAKIIVNAWEPEPYAFQGRRFTPQVAAAVAAQPYESWVNELVANWWQAPEDRPLQKRLGQIVSVDNPPITAKSWVPSLLRAWEQDLWPIQETPHFVPIAAQVDAPPTGYRPWLKTALDSWTPSPVLLWQNGFLAQDGPSQVPFKQTLFSTILAWEPEPYTQQRQKGVVQASAAVVTQPYESYQSELVATWTPELEYRQARRFLVQVPAAQVDSPIPGYRPWLRAALDSWAQSPILLWQNGFLAQDGPTTGAQPFGRREWRSGTLGSWEERLVPLWGVIGTQAPDSIPFVRPWLTSVLKTWEPEEITPRAGRFFPIVAAAQVDNPPFGLRSWTPTVRALWEPDPYAIQTTEKIIQPAAADNPPFGLRPWGFTVRDSWEPAPYAIQVTEKIAQEAVAPPNLHRLYKDITTGRLFWAVSSTSTSNPIIIIPL